ncbi:beta strand repeat-containing protein [Pseudahrensia aquimaris]|uniref:Beta strand repeat-containing protein n=1 Tax=Pseudahrensia aquimaris TaxID=744461 RepID=A0ABW3FG95_9HYPH
MATITTFAGSVLTRTSVDGGQSTARDLILVESATSYVWVTGSNDRVTLTGTFTYPGGLGTDPEGDVTQIEWDTDNDGNTDLIIDFGTSPLPVGEFLSGNASFWVNALSQADTGTISGAIENFGIDIDYSVFGLDGTLAFPAATDTVTITSTGFVAGDSARGSPGSVTGTVPTSAFDNLTFDRGQTGLSVIIGDHGYFSPANYLAATEGDQITDISTVAGETWLIGDVHMLRFEVEVQTGDDTITGGSQSATIIGDVYKMGGADVADGEVIVTAGADVLVGGTADDLIIGDVYEVSEGSADNQLNAGDDVVDGGLGNDTIHGDYFQNTLGALVIGGDDEIDGGEGDDIIHGQTGDDTLNGGGDDDVLSGGTGNDTIDGDSGNDTVTYETSVGAVTVLLGLAGADGIATGEGTDTLRELENVIGSAFDDTITGNEEDNVIAGGDGNDVLDGGDGDDTADYSGASAGVVVDLEITTQQMTGGGGNDTLLNFENVTGSDFADVVFGTEGQNTLIGGKGNDTLSGGDGADNIFGGIGNDTIRGGEGFDDLDGGGGIDTVDYSQSAGRVVIKLNVLASGGDASGDRLSGFENVIGSENDVDLIQGTEGDNLLDGRGGVNDYVQYLNATSGVTVDLSQQSGTAQDTIGAGMDILLGFESVTGSGFDDVLIGSDENNNLFGSGGDDDIDGGAGADTMIGGLGNDEYWIEDAGDSVTELAGEGYDRVYVDGLASYTLGNNVERLTFLDTGNHTATGNDLANRFDGNAGNDTFILDAGGNDIFSGGQGQDTFDARAGSLGIDIDLVSGTHGGDAAGDLFASMEVFWGSNNAAVSDTMVTGAARAKFYGFAGDDDLTGGATVDYLDGGLGNDTLNGTGARDGLRGFVGDDILTGGADRDYFQYVFAEFDHDTITDYEDGLDYLRVFSDVANAVTDFTITGNGTSSVLLTLNDGTGDNTITLNSDGGSNITIDASDFLFY